jgi:hypothetical protein
VEDLFSKSDLSKGDRGEWLASVGTFVIASNDLAEVRSDKRATDGELQLYEAALNEARARMMTTPAPDQTALDLKFRIFARDDCGSLPLEQALPIMEAILKDIDRLPG